MDTEKRSVGVAVRNTFLIGLLCATCVVSQAALQNQSHYWEMCDASAAVALDAQHFVVADDEGNVLRVYKRGEPKPVNEFNVAKFLLGKGKKSETDLEGAAMVGNRIYWISSHGRNREGEEAPNRQRFFATAVTTQGGLRLIPVGAPYPSLLDD